MLRSPHGMVWQYTAALERTLRRAHATPEGEERLQDLAVCLLLAISVVETFVNAFFRRLSLTEDYRHLYESVTADLTSKPAMSLERKLQRWPKRFFGKALDPTADAVTRFKDVKARRNALMHFSSDPVVLRVGGVGPGVYMVPTEAFDDLQLADGVAASNAAFAMIRELIAMRHSEPARIEHELSLWTSTVPTSRGEAGGESAGQAG